MILGMKAGTVRVGEGLYSPIPFSRDWISVAVDVVGIGVRVGAVGVGGWFYIRVAIR